MTAGKTAVPSTFSNLANPLKAYRTQAGDPLDLFGSRRQSEAEKADEESRAKENEMEARRHHAIDAVNRIFGFGSDAESQANKRGRELEYQKAAGATFGVNKDKLDRDLTKSERQLRFALARSGLFGGSADIDEHGEQQNAYDQGILQSRNLADTSAAKLRAADESAHLNMLNQINSGMDEATTLNNAGTELRNNIDQASANAQGQLLSNVFDNAALMYQQQQLQGGAKDAQNRWRAPGAFFNAPSSSGTVSRY